MKTFRARWFAGIAGMLLLLPALFLAGCAAAPAGSTSTTQPTVLGEIQTGTAAAAPIVAGVVPPPWGLIASGALMATSAVLGLFAAKQTSAKNAAML